MKCFAKKFIPIYLCLAVLFVLSIPLIAESTTGISAGKDFLEVVGQKSGVDTTTSVQQGVGFIIQRALQLVGSVFLCLVVYAGFLWFVARDDETQAKKAKDTGTMAIIGLIIILSSYAITSLVINQTNNSNEANPAQPGAIGCCMDYVGVDGGYDIGWVCSIKTAAECAQQAKQCTGNDEAANFEFKDEVTDIDTCIATCTGEQKIEEEDFKACTN